MHETLGSTDAKHTYDRGADILAASAEVFGIRIGETTHEEWRLLTRAAYELDSVLDSSLPADQREMIFDSLVSDVLGPHADQDENGCYPDCVFCQLQDFSVNWDEARKVEMQAVANTVKEVSLLRRQAVHARSLGELAVQEGRAVAHWFGLPATNNNERFYSWLEDLIITGVAFDSAIDLPKDFEGGLTAVRPTKLNRLIIGSYGVPALVKTVTQTNPRLFKRLIGAARAVAEDSNKDLLRATS